MTSEKYLRLHIVARAPRPHSRSDRHDKRHAHRNPRQHKVPPNRSQRSRPPSQQRPNPRQKQQKQSHRNIHPVIKRRTHRNLRALHILTQNREQRSPQHHKASHQQNQIVEQKTRLAAHQRLQLVLALQMVHVHEERKQTNRKHNQDEPVEPVTNRALRKRMHRTHNPRPRQQRPQDRQHKRGEDQPHIPRLHHAALLLHHHRVQKRRPRQPRHQARILNRVPTPVPAPPQHAISPVRAQKDPARQKQPRHHRPSPRNVDPLLARIPHHQRPQRKRKRHRKSHIPQIKHRGMNHHLRILQQRIQPKPIRLQRLPAESQTAEPQSSAAVKKKICIPARMVDANAVSRISTRAASAAQTHTRSAATPTAAATPPARSKAQKTCKP